MSLLKMTVRSKVAVAATAVAAAVLPFQAGAAHASTPSDDLTVCVRDAIANMDDAISSEVDSCVEAYLTELGIDDSSVSVDTTSVSVDPTDASGDAVNTGILGTAGGDATAG
jgi:hypothetical protein